MAEKLPYIESRITWYEELLKVFAIYVLVVLPTIVLVQIFQHFLKPKERISKGPVSFFPWILLELLPEIRVKHATRMHNLTEQFLKLVFVQFLVWFYWQLVLTSGMLSAILLRTKLKCSFWLVPTILASPSLVQAYNCENRETNIYPMLNFQDT